MFASSTLAFAASLNLAFWVPIEVPTGTELEQFDTVVYLTGINHETGEATTIDPFRGTPGEDDWHLSARKVQRQFRRGGMGGVGGLVIGYNRGRLTGTTKIYSVRDGAIGIRRDLRRPPFQMPVADLKRALQLKALR